MDIKKITEQEVSDIIQKENIDLSSFEVQSTLNPKIFDKEQHMYEDVRRRILMIADDFFETLSVFFANIPYDIILSHEKYYQSLFFAIFKLIGFSIEVEVKTNKGRIDCVLETNDMICIIEFKLKGSKEQALQQIHDTEYGQKYQLSDKQKVLIGVEFDQDTRNIGGFVIG